MIKEMLSKLRSWPGSGQKTAHGSRKVLIGVATILFVLVVVQTGWNKYHHLGQGLQERIDLKTVQYEKSMRIIDQGQAYRQKNSRLNTFKQELMARRLLQGDTPALAEAKLQNLVNDLAEKAQVDILSMRMLPREKEEKSTLLNIGINCRAEIDAVREFLYQIDQDDRFIYISELEVKIVNRREKRYFNLSAHITALAQIV